MDVYTHSPPTIAWTCIQWWIITYLHPKEHLRTECTDKGEYNLLFCDKTWTTIHWYTCTCCWIPLIMHAYIHQVCSTWVAEPSWTQDCYDWPIFPVVYDYCLQQFRRLITMITACMLTAFKVVISLLSTVKATNCHTPCDSVWVSMQKHSKPHQPLCYWTNKSQQMDHKKWYTRALASR